jgi:DNA-binding CsgD family transcriptional regulator
VQSFKSQVAELRKQGYTNKAIAKQLKVSFSRVMETVGELVADGAVKSRRPRAKWTEKGSADFKRVVELLKSGATLAEIGEVLHVSRERVRQIREKIRKRYGDRIVQPKPQPYVTVREAARQLHTERGPLRKLLLKSGLLTKNSRGVWVVLRSHLRLKKVTEHPHVSKKRKCKYCGKTFRLKHRAQTVCSVECNDARRKGTRQKCFEAEPSEHNLAGWHKDLWLRLRDHRPPERDEWLTLGQASERCGLTSIQVNWLRLRKVLRCRPSETQFWRGQQMHLYRASELEIVRQCREVFLRSESR